MKTLDLAHETATVEDLLRLAAAGAVKILSRDGHAFVLEEADDFDREVETLSKSEKFQRFLDERAKEPPTTSLEDFKRSLDI